MVTFEDLEKDPFYSNLINILKANHGDPLPDWLKTFVVDQNSWSEVVPSQVLQWVEDLHTISERIISGSANSSDIGLFWIRLNRTLKELEKYFAPNGLGIQISKHFSNCYQLITKLRNSFTDDELLWIEHERHCQAHPIPDYYRKTVTKGKDGKFHLKDSYGELPIDELNKKLRAVIQPYNSNSSKLALDICKRIQAILKELAFEARKWRNES